MRLIRVILTGLLLLCSFFAFSANITPIELNGASANYVERADFLEISPADENGISYNKFSQFDLGGIDLKVLNISKTNQASIIVIETNDANLDANIKLVGSTAELLILAQNNTSSLACNNCAFDGFNRVTLATAKLQSNYSPTREIGSLESTAGSLTINHLSAPNILMLDVLSNNLSLGGVVNTNTRVSKDPLGGYVDNKNGEYLLGGGSLNLNVGDHVWDYESREVLSSVLSSNEITLAGVLESAEVKILSARKLKLNSTIRNQVDVLSSAMYRGQVLVPSNSTEVISLSNHPMIFNGHYFSNGLIDLKSASSLTLNTTTIKAKAFKALAKNELMNLGSIEADNVSLSGISSINRGNIKSKDKTQIWAHGFLGNEYGGSIHSKHVLLISSQGVVRNGSRTPYITTSSAVKSKIFDHTHTLNPSAIEEGMYYATNHLALNKVKPSSITANIYGGTVEIKGAAFESINPYWTDIKYSNGIAGAAVIDARHDLINGVNITADKALIIDVTGYAYNSSGTLRVNSPVGQLSISGSLMANERYRQMNLLAKEEITISANNASKKIFSRSYVYSPPGRIYSAGKFYASAPIGIVNNVSFFEIKGNAEIKSGSIQQIGFNHAGLHRNVIPAYAANNCFNSDPNCSQGIIEYTKEIKTEPINLADIGAFFSIGGTLKADKSKFHPKNANAFNQYLRNAINDKVESEIDMTQAPDTYMQDCVYICNGPIVRISSEKTLYDNVESVLNSIGEGELIPINMRVEAVVTAHGNLQQGGTSPSELSRTETYSEEWNVIDVISEYYEKIKNTLISKIQDLQEQLGWWS